MVIVNFYDINSFFKEKRPLPSKPCSNIVYILTVLDVMLGIVVGLHDGSNIEHMGKY